MTEKEFLWQLKTNSRRYQDNISYFPIPKATRKLDANSNSYVGTILRESGSDYSPILHSPGWNVQVPLLLNLILYQPPPGVDSIDDIPGIQDPINAPIFYDDIPAPMEGIEDIFIDPKTKAEGDL